MKVLSMLPRVMALLLGLAAVGCAVLFWFQNAARTTQLSLNLGLVAWELSQPLSVPVLVASSVGVGFFLGSLVFGWLALAASRRARRAERAVPPASTWAPPPQSADGWK